MTVELWVDIAKHPNYQVSDQGRVRNWTTGTYPKLRKVKDVGVVVSLSEPGVKQAVSRPVHELLYTSFHDLEEIPSGWQLIHKDGDIFNNHRLNLSLELEDVF